MSLVHEYSEEKNTHSPTAPPSGRMLISCGWRRLDVRRLMNPECALEHGGGHNHTLYGSFPPFCSSANLVDRIHERFARSCIQSEWNQLRHYSPFNQIRVIKTNSLKQTGARRGIVFFFVPKKRIFHLVQYYYERKELTAKLLDIFRPPSSPSPDRPRPTTQLELSATRSFRSRTRQNPVQVQQIFSVRPVALKNFRGGRINSCRRRRRPYPGAARR